jgi:hypothetical protein
MILPHGPIRTNVLLRDHQGFLKVEERGEKRGAVALCAAAPLFPFLFPSLGEGGSGADIPIPRPLPHPGGRGEYQKKGCFEWRCHSKHPFFWSRSLARGMRMATCPPLSPLRKGAGGWRTAIKGVPTLRTPCFVSITYLTNRFNTIYSLYAWMYPFRMTSFLSHMLFSRPGEDRYNDLKNEWSVR